MTVFILNLLKTGLDNAYNETFMSPDYKRQKTKHALNKSILDKFYCDTGLYLYKCKIAEYHSPLIIRIIHLACVCLKQWGCGEQEVTELK